MVLLNKTGKITLADNKTNIVLPFEIKDDFKSLKINFEYSPKTLEDKAKEIKIAEDCLEKYGEVQEGNIENICRLKILLPFLLIQVGNISVRRTGRAISRNTLFLPLFRLPDFLRRILQKVNGK